MQPFKPPSKNELFSGLTFSLNNINLENSGLNLVPISLDNASSFIEVQQKDFNTSKEDNLPPLMLSNESMDNKTKKNGMDESNNSGIYSRYVLNPEAQVCESKVMENNVNLTGDLIPRYEPVSYHWFYQNAENIWRPFSMLDSTKLEYRFISLSKNNHLFTSMDSCGQDIDDCVAVEGGRYDVHIRDRLRVSIYWHEESLPVRRVSWLYREEEGRCQIPYSEQECALLESKYCEVMRFGTWHQWLQIPGISNENVIEDQFVFHSPHTMAQYRRYEQEETLRARVVFRGVGSLIHLLERGDSEHIDHVVLVVHGIGPICDMRGHNLIECVSEMRKTSATMIRDHYGGHNGRLEYLPVCWNSSLHTHIDSHLARVTLSSVPKLRVFTNGALVDVLCYSSPGYCQTIITSVAAEMNRLRHLFMSRNPGYDGTFSIIGHSLGAVIALDLISLQHSPSALRIPLQDPDSVPALEFELGHLFALGSPVALFLTARGLPFLGPDFRLPGCKGVVNIFHPFDPVAYRLEPMLVRECPNRPVLVPHHKGRKRLHLELKDNLAKVGSDLKTRLMQTLKITWSSLQEFAQAHSGPSSTGPADDDDDDVMRVLAKMDDCRSPSSTTAIDEDDRDAGDSTTMGALNGGHRVDFVLQEAPLESFNDYLFALGSHACYWDSEDTLLKILKEVYLSMGVVADQWPNSESQTTKGPLPPGMDHHREHIKVPLPPAMVAGHGGPPPPPPMMTGLPMASISPPSMQPRSMAYPHIQASMPILSRTSPAMAVMSPPLPVIQTAPFFLPSTSIVDADNIQSGGSTSDQSEWTPPQPPAVVAATATAPPSIIAPLPPLAPSYNHPSTSTEPSQSFMRPYHHSSQSSSYFQPHATESTRSNNTYFCPASEIVDVIPPRQSLVNEPPSLESIYYEKFDHVLRTPSPTSGRSSSNVTHSGTQSPQGNVWPGDVPTGASSRDEHDTRISSNDVASLWACSAVGQVTGQCNPSLSRVVPSECNYGDIALASSWDTSDLRISSRQDVGGPSDNVVSGLLEVDQHDLKDLSRDYSTTREMLHGRTVIDEDVSARVCPMEGPAIDWATNELFSEPGKVREESTMSRGRSWTDEAPATIVGDGTWTTANVDERSDQRSDQRNTNEECSSLRMFAAEETMASGTSWIKEMFGNPREEALVAEIHGGAVYSSGNVAMVSLGSKACDGETRQLRELWDDRGTVDGSNVPRSETCDASVSMGPRAGDGRRPSSTISEDHQGRHARSIIGLGPSRTPSPYTATNHNVRPSARSAVTGTNLFSGRPLVPQSGKMFPRKKT